MDQTEEKEVEVHLAEYEALRSEINLSNQRIDRIIGFYLTAIFAILAYFLRPDSGSDLPKYLDRVRSSDILTAFLLILPILNSVLLIRLATFFLSTLAMAKYLLYKVSMRLTILLKSPVLCWDRSTIIDAKTSWSIIGSLAQSLFFVLSEGLSILILVNTSYVYGRGRFIWVLYLGSCFSVLLSFLAVAAVLYVFLNFHRPPSPKSPATPSPGPPAQPAKASPLPSPLTKNPKATESYEESEYFWGLVAGSSATGLLYLFIFLPLTYYAAKNMGGHHCRLIALHKYRPPC